MNAGIKAARQALAEIEAHLSPAKRRLMIDQLRLIDLVLDQTGSLVGALSPVVSCRDDLRRTLEQAATGGEP